MKSTALPPFQFFGSHDSMDLDVVFFLPTMPHTIIEKATLAKQHAEVLSHRYPDQKINVNFAVCKEGVINEVYKGSADELNNALYLTYDLHKQVFKNQIVKTLPRDPHLKALRCLRVVLSLCSKTQYRASVKEALKSDIYQKIATLKEIKFEAIADLGKSQDMVEVKKTFAFQLGQTLALLEGMECYTKSEVASLYPELRPYLTRKISTDWLILQNFSDLFLSKLEPMIPYMKHTEEYPYKKEAM